MGSEMCIRDRAWTATALLPAAPLDDDPILMAARAFLDNADTASPRDRAIVHGVPYPVAESDIGG